MNTVIDQTREDIAKLFKGIGVEVGVANGDFAEIILANPKVTGLFGVDLYEPHKGYQDYTRGTTFNNMRKNSAEKLKHFGQRHAFIYKFSMDAVKDFANNSLDFVYIDANHSYKTVFEDITEWAKRVRPGGVIAGDDYTPSIKPNNGVIRAVNEYAEKNGVTVLFIYKGKEPVNWMFYKP